MSDFDGLERAMGADSPAVVELRELYRLADAYGLTEWLVLDLSVVRLARPRARSRAQPPAPAADLAPDLPPQLPTPPPPLPPQVRGLAYYTGVVFEGFDRSGTLRAIFGGGRYDRLLSTFGGDDTPAAGFGFGDAVIVELLREKGLLPSFERRGATVLLACLGDAERPAAMAAAAALREAGATVDLVLEPKKAKWVFKHADRVGSKFVGLVGPDEAAAGNVRIKRLADGEQSDVAMGELGQWAAEQQA